MDLRLFAGFHDLFFRGSRLTVSDVLRDGRREQEYILGHQRDLLPQGFPVPFLNPSAKEPVFSGRLFIEAAQNAKDRALSAAGLSYKCDVFSFFYRKSQSL